MFSRLHKNKACTHTHTYISCMRITVSRFLQSFSILRTHVNKITLSTLILSSNKWNSWDGQNLTHTAFNKRTNLAALVSNGQLFNKSMEGKRRNTKIVKSSNQVQWVIFSSISLLAWTNLNWFSVFKEAPKS